jgi:hypothetical protein
VVWVFTVEVLADQLQEFCTNLRHDGIAKGRLKINRPSFSSSFPWLLVGPVRKSEVVVMFAAFKRRLVKVLVL